MKQHTRGISYVLTIAAILFSGMSAAQTATGTSTTNCTQNGTAVTCATTTTIVLPGNVNLTAGSGLNSFTLTSGVETPAAPSGCSINPGNASFTVGTTPTLTVTCNVGSSPLTYVWLRNNVAVGTNSRIYTLTATDTAVAGTATYLVTVSNALGSTSAATSVTVTSGSGIAAPSNCSISPAGSTVTVGTTPTFSVLCGGGPVSNYAWTRNGAAVGVNASTYTATAGETAVAGTANYAVTASNSAGQAQASTTLTITPGTILAQNFCPGNQSHNTTLNAASTYTRLDSTSLIGTNSHYVVKVDVPASGASTAGRLPVLFSHVEAPSSQRSFRAVSISKNLCDYAAGTDTFIITTQSAGGSKEITVDDPRSGFINLAPGTWYINVKNTTGSCPSNQFCNVALEWSNY